MQNNSDVKNQVREAIDFVDLVSQYTKLTPSGAKFKGLSPFTNEKTPSFYVDPDKKLYYCFSSQKGGDVFSFIQEVEGLDFKESLKLLANKVGINLTTNYPKKNLNQYEILENAKKQFISQLFSEVKEYLNKRGLTDETIKKWSLGYAKDSWDSVCTSSIKNKKEYANSGLCIEKENKFYDRFRDRIIFPFFDLNDRVIGFSGRAYKDDSSAKYINSPETELFHKSSFLFGLNFAKGNIRKNNFSILTEGPVDAIMVHQAGFPCAVATSGTSITLEHLNILKKYSNRIILSLDNDNAGKIATMRILPMALSIGMDVKVLSIDGEEKDPADVIKKDKERFKTLVKNSKKISEFLFEYIKDKYSEEREEYIRGLKDEIFPILMVIKDPLLKETLIQEFADFTKLSVETISEAIKNVPTEKRLILETDNVFERKQLPKGKDIKINIDILLKQIAYNKTYLMYLDAEFSESTKKGLDEICKYTNLPDVEEDVSIHSVESKFENKEERVEKVTKETVDLIRRAIQELRKRAEVDKIKTK